MSHEMTASISGVISGTALSASAVVSCMSRRQAMFRLITQTFLSPCLDSRSMHVDSQSRSMALLLCTCPSTLGSFSRTIAQGLSSPREIVQDTFPLIQHSWYEKQGYTIRRQCRSRQECGNERQYCQWLAVVSFGLSG